MQNIYHQSEIIDSLSNEQFPDSIHGINRDVDSAVDSFSSSPFITGEPAHTTSSEKEILVSRNINPVRVDDWYLLIVLGILVTVAWVRVSSSKYINTLFSSAFNYQSATKNYSGSTIVNKRISFIFDIIYFLTGSLYLLEIYHFSGWKFLGDDNLIIFTGAASFLIFLVLLRVVVMTVTGIIFDRYELFKSFLYHFYLYSKVLGIILIPFVILLPYTSFSLHDVLFYGSLFIIALLFMVRLLRVVVFLIKNVVSLFYLFLYLCAVELLPVLVIIKLFVSLM